MLAYGLIHPIRSVRRQGWQFHFKITFELDKISHYVSQVVYLLIGLAVALS